ncbi:DUF2993 domain-containing protein [Agromyces sp. CFH 90414]|uniref:DUF2993 domain-containing protein n=1 Tax=Agromyces agglutinans TaxID=2662258 RepID=A0A6I2FID7_9MICO|nr:DUF2993 domain-containing protein [Agromyces agglutinans]MRG61723.1 DUF2993 domain-containing protein [Agromyces agglutinans]
MALGRSARGWLIAGGVVVVVAGGLVLADVLVRTAAEQRIAEAVEEQLPDGVSGDVNAKVGGFSVLLQSLGGRAEQVELHAPELVVDGAPMVVDVVAHDVPLDLAQPVGRIDATIRIDEASLNTLAVAQGVPGGFTLGDGVVGYDGTVEVLGIPFRYSATAEPEAAGDRVLLRPVSVEVGAGGATIDLSQVTDRVLGGDPLTVCTAESLPEGVEVSGVTASPGVAEVRLEATGLVLDEEHLSARGSCD